MACTTTSTRVLQRFCRTRTGQGRSMSAKHQPQLLACLGAGTLAGPIATHMDSLEVLPAMQITHTYTTQQHITGTHCDARQLSTKGNKSRPASAQECKSVVSIWLIGGDRHTCRSNFLCNKTSWSGTQGRQATWGKHHGDAGPMQQLNQHSTTKCCGYGKQSGQCMGGSTSLVLTTGRHPFAPPPAIRRCRT